MLLPSPLLPLLLLVPSLASAALSMKGQRLAAKAASSKDGILKLDSASYDELVGGDRDYSVSVVLTAMDPGFKCAPCRTFDPSFRDVSSSWSRLPKDQRSTHIFASLDFQDGQAVYKSLGLSTAPTLFFFPPSNGSEKVAPIGYDINANGFSSESLLNFIRPKLTHSFELYRPRPWGKIISAPFLLGGALYGLFIFRSFFLPIVTSKHLWTVATLLIILTFTTGYMWNKIKDAPYMVMDREGRSQWLAGGFSNQYGAESQVVAVIYGVLAFTFVALSNLVPTLRDPAKQKIGVILWVGVMLLVFSILLNIFKIKNGSYPFKLLF
ncbi:putative dolichyl-diphosphooligosaccharide-protein glycotransferase [Mrakia frigida]|uniref:dolichyl-diphosphooligosaccharide--protein glycotransferase OST3 n=1 Tax=Mrakia frigida TaxID=29902 RepID=UPI003FCBF3C8